MEAPGAPRTIVLDANVVINFLHIGRLDLLASLPGYSCVIPEDVAAEITDASQREQLEQAVAAGRFVLQTITEPSDLIAYADLRRVLGRGESACIVLAARHEWLVASDEKGRFRRELVDRIGADRLVNTAGLLVVAIRAGLMTIEAADDVKALLEQHRFRLTFDSFRDIL